MKLAGRRFKADNTPSNSASFIWGIPCHTMWWWSLAWTSLKGNSWRWGLSIVTNHDDYVQPPFHQQDASKYQLQGYHDSWKVCLQFVDFPKAASRQTVGMRRLELIKQTYDDYVFTVIPMAPGTMDKDIGRNYLISVTNAVHHFICCHANLSTELWLQSLYLCAKPILCAQVVFLLSCRINHFWKWGELLERVITKLELLLSVQEKSESMFIAQTTE